jgi:hypothetical protein
MRKEVWKYKAVCKKDDDCPKYGTIMHSWNGNHALILINYALKEFLLCEILI